MHNSSISWSTNLREMLEKLNELRRLYDHRANEIQKIYVVTYVKYVKFREIKGVN